MELLHLLSGPLVGAVIGYVTNDIAIRMLFRPRKAVYLFGVRLPFTPGIVPRRKDQLAGLLGNAIVEKFFNADDLEIVFTDGIADAVADELCKLLRSAMPPAEVTAVLPEGVPERLETELCIRIQAAVATSRIPEALTAEGVRMADAALSESPAGRLLASGLTDAFRKALADQCREFIIEHGREFILPLVRDELARLGSTPLSDTVSSVFDMDEAQLRQVLRTLYLRFMARHVRPIVESIDVGGMITEKITLMSAMEVEDLVLTVVRRELRLVVLFGAFVGGLIGVVNLFL